MTADTAAALLLLSAGAFFVPPLARRLRLPAAVGEILFGIVVGRGGLDLVAETEAVRFLAHLGFLFVMFIAGLEIDFDVVEADRAARRRAAAGVAALFAASEAVRRALDLPPVALVLLPALSLGIAVPVLRETGTIRAPTGQAVLVFGAVGEIATLVALTVFETWFAHGFGAGLAMDLARLGLVIGGAALALRTLATLAWWMPERFAGVAERHDPQESGVRLALALLFGFVGIALLLGVEGIVGAFLAGATLGYCFREIRHLEGKIAGAGFGFFIPVFFIHVGMRFDPRGLFAPRIVLPALGWFAALAALRLVLVPFLYPSAGFRRGLGAALLLGAPFTLLVAIAEVAHDLGAMTDAEVSSVVLAAVLTAVVLPAAYRAFLSWKEAAAAPHEAFAAGPAALSPRRRFVTLDVFRRK